MTLTFTDAVKQSGTTQDRKYGADNRRSHADPAIDVGETCTLFQPSVIK